MIIKYKYVLLLQMMIQSKVLGGKKLFLAKLIMITHHIFTKSSSKKILDDKVHQRWERVRVTTYERLKKLRDILILFLHPHPHAWHGRRECIKKQFRKKNGSQNWSQKISAFFFVKKIIAIKYIQYHQTERASEGRERERAAALVVGCTNIETVRVRELLAVVAALKNRKILQKWSSAVSNTSTNISMHIYMCGRDI